MKRILITVGAITIIGIAIATLLLNRSSGPSSQLVPLRVGFNTWLGYSPLIIAQDKGFLREAGIDASVVMIEGVAEKNAALLRGDIDAVGHTADSAVTSAAAGVDGQIVYVFDKSFGADGIVAKDAIKTIKDLKGKRVAVEPGFTGHFFLLTLLAQNGLKPSDIEMVAMDTGSAGAAFAAGKVDAAVTWEPWIGKVKTMPGAHVLVTSAQEPGLIIDVLFMNRSTIDKNPELITKLVTALGRAVTWYEQHGEAGDQIMAQFWKLSLPETTETVAGMRFMDIQQNSVFFGTEAAPGQLYQTISSADRLWREAGVTKKSVDAKRLIDFRSITEASAGRN
jgi:NitT/TauT family transport system substrate-binding protein